MLSRIEAKGLGLRLIENWRDTLSSADPLGKIHGSRTALYTYSRLSPKIRMINQSPFSHAGWHRTSSLVRNAVPVGEMLHVSALERWKSLPRYRPVNLIGALDAIFDAQRPKRLLIAGDTGKPLDWYRNNKDREELAALLPADYRKKMEDALLYWQTAGVDLSIFMDISRQTDPPLAQSIPLQRSLKVA